MLKRAYALTYAFPSGSLNYSVAEARPTAAPGQRPPAPKAAQDPPRLRHGRPTTLTGTCLSRYQHTFLFE